MVNFGAIFDTVGKGVGNLADGIGKKKAIVAGQKGISENQAYLDSQTALMKNEYDSQMTPYVQGGKEAFGNIENMSGNLKNYDQMSGDKSDYAFEMGDFKADPGYQFRLSQGTEVLDQGAAGDGSLFSGGQQKALLDYGQNLASDEYQNVYNREFGEFQDMNNNFQGARDYNTSLDANNYNREFGSNKYLADTGYNANLANANTGLALEQGRTQGQLNYNTDMASGDSARLMNAWGTVGDQNRIAGQGAKDYFSLGSGSGSGFGG